MYLTQGLHRMLQQNPDALAMAFRDRRHTYRQLAERVARLAGALQQLGMHSGDRIGMLSLNSDRFLEYYLATWWGGGVVNPVNIRWSVAEIVYSLDDCDTRILLIDDTFVPMAQAIASSARVRPLLIHVGDGPAPEGMLGYEQLIETAVAVGDASRGGDDLACILYTGGTTGRPKGVMLSHMNLWSAAVARCADVPVLDDARSLHIAPMFHLAALSRVILVSLLGLPSFFVPAFDAVDVMRTIARERITDILIVPTMLQALIMHPEFPRHDLSCLRDLTYGASPIAVPLLELALKALPQVRFTQGYGMTEAAPPITANGPHNHGAEGIANGRLRSAGRPGLGVTVRIVDEHDNEVPCGTVGEVVVRGPNIMLGYWNKPEETAQALRGGWMHTGDGAYMDKDGYIYIVDRFKDMIVSGGENVYSGEVESAIASHPAVAACAVIGIPCAQWGEAVHAVIVLKTDALAREADIIEHCRRQIASYKAPKTVEFRAGLPLSGAGKVLKRELREPFWGGKDRGVS
ncbi:long-chain fatty acid--CoA ligase [Pseudomonas sp. GD03860]|uniref:acyl-CoA synthetase n=1 Tax=Pseudomonas TaxID=286 RepID=UPI002363C682|nr:MULTISPECIES: long-chain fatty acid--CoA ligase [Pseudomonas]MDD2058175.1 long-chain fatty acid--CoA ligase [Pseudomonas putida]MDH0636109.1 long-chain fatty acid--CoA ligase [Pseudomonas sp. GD03860]